MVKKEKVIQTLSKEEREKISNEITLKLALLDLDRFEDIKKLKIILKLFVDHGREHTEDMDIPSLDSRVLQIRLFNNKNKQSKVLLKNTN